MGRRGPAPEPTILKLAKGNPGRRPLNRREPKPQKGAPACPAWLGEDAKSVWDETAALLSGMGVLTHADGHALARYCDALCRWRHAKKIIDKYGNWFPVKDEDGKLRYMQQLPEVAIYHKLSLMLLRLEQEFGMTPSARTRIEVPPQHDEEDGFAQFLRARHG